MSYKQKRKKTKEVPETPFEEAVQQAEEGLEPSHRDQRQCQATWSLEDVSDLPLARRYAQDRWRDRRRLAAEQVLWADQALTDPTRGEAAIIWWQARKAEWLVKLDVAEQMLHRIDQALSREPPLETLGSS